MKIKTLLLAVLVITTCTLHAQSKKGKRGKHNVPEAYKAEMKAFYQNEMYPILKEKHDEFDAALSADDLTKLQNLRAENKAIQKQMIPIIIKIKKSIKAERKEGKMDRAAFREKYGKKMQGLRKNQRANRSKLKPIIENNQELVKSTMAEVMELKKEWGEQMKAIATKHGVKDHKGRRGRRGGKFKGKDKRKHKTEGAEEGVEQKTNDEPRKGKKGKRGKGKRGGKRMRPVVKFLLWDGSIKSIAEVDESAAKAIENQPKVEQNFPNPATNSTRINFKLPKAAQNVRLVVTNMDGKVMNEQTFKQLTAGQHQVNLNVADWNKGIYFYTISTEGFKKTKKMSIQ